MGEKALINYRFYMFAKENGLFPLTEFCLIVKRFVAQ
jgi:hypothetical protein